MRKATTSMKAATRAAGYLRVSTTEQATEGVSLAAQEAAVRAYAAMRGLELAQVIVDAGVSGGRPLADRDGGRRLLDLVASRAVGHVVALKLDRLFRDCGDALATTRTWDATGAALHLIDMGGQAIDTSSAMGRFFLTVMAGAAELEKNLIGERTAAALGHLRATGIRLGGPRLGERRGAACDASGRRVIEPVAEEAATVARIRALAESGAGLRAIVNALEAEGRRPRGGGRWWLSTIRRIVARLDAAPAGAVA